MSKVNGFEYKELIDYAKKLAKADISFNNWLTEFLLEMANRALAKIKPNTPVDTGALRASWFITDIEQIGNELAVTIANGMEYASYVEYGHALRDGNWYEGKYMMTIGIDEIQQQIPKRFEKEFKQYLENLGV